MFHVYEFEVFESEGWFVALPFGLDGGTQGSSYSEVCALTADWLRMTCEHLEMSGQAFPQATFGNKPRHGGQIMIVGVDASLDKVRKVSASDAARMLGVSPGRVSQLLGAAQLEGWREGNRTWVTLDSVEARLAEAPKAGRPSGRLAKAKTD